MVSALCAGVVYFALVFAVAFMLGVVRQSVVAPMVGAVAAVLVEVPMILVVSYIACRAVVARFDLSGALNARAVMGATAFLCLMAAEFVLAQLLFGMNGTQFAQSFATVEGLIGLAGQVAFAAMPSITSGRAARN